MGMTHAGRTARSSGLRPRVARATTPNPNPLTPARQAGCRQGPTQLLHRLDPKSQGDGHGVHHLDRAAVRFAGVVVRGHGFT